MGTRLGNTLIGVVDGLFVDLIVGLNVTAGLEEGIFVGIEDGFLVVGLIEGA